MTKDRDFVGLVEELGIPPQVIWLTCGNTCNARLKEILKHTFDKTIELIEAGEPVVEINAALDVNNRTGELGVELILSGLGKTIL